MMRPLLLAAALIAAPALAADSAPVRLNQIGFLPDAVKRAIVPSASKQSLRWTLVDSAGAVRASGRTTVFGPDPASGEQVHRVDFTGFRRSGTAYRLRVGALASRPFPIAGDVYRSLPGDALAYFYHNRAGMPIEARFVGPRHARPAGHPRESATCLASADSAGNRWPGCAHTLDVTGGWYDAGDHGKYVVNGGISLWTLLNLYERRPGAFPDGSARIPEAGNGISDLLDEARFEMEFLLRMQVPAGTRMQVPVGLRKVAPGLAFTPIDASGMAHHKVADENWTALPMRPDKDPERRQLFAPTTAATLNLAATAAQCARVWRTVDPAFSSRCLQAAERAWAAARRNPEVFAIADHSGSGGYGDSELGDEFYWAAAELFATTDAAEYRAAVMASPHYRAPVAGEAGWASVAPLGTITLAAAPALAAAERERLVRAIAAAADRFLADRQRTGYAVPHAGNTVWGSTSNLLNRAMLMAVAFDHMRQPRYRDGVVDAMDYVLGRNPLDRSFVTGYGARPMANPHHRFWANSLDPSYPPPPPGALSGGPNISNMSDEVAAKLKGKCAPQTCWADDARAYSLNEVAINWNAPLLWVSSWLTGAPMPPGERG